MPSLDEADARRATRSTTPQPRADLWSAMAHRPARAVLAGLLVGLLLAVVGAVIVLSGRTVYTSTTTMLIDDPYQLATSGQVTEFSNLDALRYKYSGLVATEAIAAPVAAKLHLPVGAVIGAVSTDVPLNSLLMDVRATWTSPREAQRISLASAHEVTTYIADEDNLYDIAPVNRFSFKVIDPATAAVAKGPSKSKAATLAIGLGVLGFALGFFGTQLVRYLRGS